jgi:RNA polymerase sigma factor (sigma-70 family)
MHAALVCRIATKVRAGLRRKMACDEADLCSVGNLALIDAIRTYSPRHGRFDQFARLVVWRAMEAYVEQLRLRPEISLDSLPSKVVSSLRHEMDKDILEVDSIRKAVMQLPERMRIVLSEIYVQDVPQKRVARLLGVTEGRVSQLHSAALTTLGRILTRDKLRSGCANSTSSYRVDSARVEGVLL